MTGGTVFQSPGRLPDGLQDLGTGHTLATALPGHLMAISDRNAAFVSGLSDPGTVAGYGVATRP